VKLNASDLSVESSWTIPPPDQGGDDDFGATPVLFTAIINGVQRQLIGVINKDGMFFALDRSNLAAGPVWQTRIGYGTGSPLNIVSAAWDGSALYVGGGGTIINGSFCFESLAALNPATGGYIWSTCANGEMNSGITEVPGVVIMGTGAVGNVLFLDPENGIILNNVPVASAVLGETIVYNGVVYVPVDNGNIEALGP
jgi:polyvinyl alcohol dehydrogenase (cytochrome)